ncbi:hypothetical protein [Amycolatopsis sp. lyj-90]|uniref:hypothetical protein n=1 Tax=Amycolatopsis sp. lyj-90 TaxID=2789285 RepID=UPI00397D59E8
MSDGLISARFGDLHSIAGGLQTAMGQHEQSLDDQRHEALRSQDFWGGQNNEEMYARVMQDRKIADEDIQRGQHQGRATSSTADGYQDCVTQCSALFG